MSTSEETTSHKKCTFTSPLIGKRKLVEPTLAVHIDETKGNGKKMSRNYQEQCKRATLEIIKREELNVIFQQLCAQNDCVCFHTISLIKNGSIPIFYSFEEFQNDHAMFQGALVNYDSLSSLQRDAINHLFENQEFKDMFNAQLPTAVPSDDSTSNSFQQDIGHVENRCLHEMVDGHAQWSRENPGQYLPMENDNIVQGSFGESDISSLTDVNT